jgi:hypothetical protein
MTLLANNQLIRLKILLKLSEKNIQLKFERVGDLDAEMVSQLISNMPRNWGAGEITAVSSKDKSYRTDAGGYALADFNRGTGVVTYYQEATGDVDEVEELRGALFHESGHANDWESDNGMSYDERIEMLWHVTGRLEVKDRFYSKYVENIQDANHPKENYRKAVEYWAEIVKAYFRHPGNLDIEDFTLVDFYILKNDPHFHESKGFSMIQYLRDPSEVNLLKLKEFDAHHRQ